MKPIIAITMGDAAGIGSSIIAKALSMKKIYEVCRPLVVGDADTMEIGVEISGLGIDIRSISDLAEAKFEYGEIDVFDLENIDVIDLVMGKSQTMAGKASVEYVFKAIELALNMEVDAIVTAPINKEAINMAGYKYSGHTELLAELAETDNYAMMLIAGTLRVVHVTTHIALKQVAENITKERVLETIKLADSAARSLGLENPRIGVAGLNPHCGEGGLFGDEEIRSIRPAVIMAQELGIDSEGPIPPDTIFAKGVGGAYDIVVAMYHDQGHIPVKLLGFQWDKEAGEWSRVQGVNTTIGLPFVRTSVDHGTAYGKAGRREGTADPRSLIEAIKIAVNMVKARR